MPAERALSERFATTRITIKEALSSLEADGLIYRAERRGWFVAPPRLTYDPAIHTHFHQWIGEQQRTAETRVLAHGSELASSELCRWMGLDPLPRFMRSDACVSSMVALYYTSATICWPAAFPISPARRWPAPSPSSISSAMA